MTLEQLNLSSDIRGVAIATEEFAATLTPEVVGELSYGLVQWLRQNNEAKYQAGKLLVGIGRDSRLSGEALKNSLISGLLEQGVQVLDFGLATTPALFMATQFREFDCDCGVMLTASHLPYYYNGIKVFTKTGGAESSDIQWISEHCQKNSNGQTGACHKADLLSRYAADLVAKIRQGSAKDQEQPLTGLKIIVDAGNGAGGFFAEKVLQPLGADTTGSQFLEPDGHFPNHIPNPDNQEAMASIKAAVQEHSADLGVIFDTDVDRSAVVTKSGEALNRNNLIAVLSRIVLEEHPGTAIVTNSPTSDHLKYFIEALGGKQVRYISGYRNVINKAIQLNEAGSDSQLAIETSGHAAFKENYFLDDGAYVIAKILMLLPTLQEQGLTLDDLIKDLKQPAEAQEVRFRIHGENYRAYGEKVIAALADYQVAGWQIDPENEEGVRIKLSAPFGSGWFLLRMSLHEPLLVLQVENDQAGLLPQIFGQLHQFFQHYPNIDQEKLLPHL